MDGLVLAARDYLGGGAFGDVFQRGDRAIKVFKWPKDLTGQLTPVHAAVQRRRSVFAAELDAFLIASRIPELAAHTPAFFGPVEVADVTDFEGRSVRPWYLLDCAYSMALMEGPTADVTPEVVASHAHLTAFIAQMERHGIRRTDDMMGWHLEDPQRFVLGDFATYDAAQYADLEQEGLQPFEPPPERPLPYGSMPGEEG